MCSSNLLASDIDIELVEKLNIAPEYSSNVLRDTYENSIRANQLTQQRFKYEKKRQNDENCEYMPMKYYYAVYVDGRIVSAYIAYVEIEDLKGIVKLDDTIYNKYLVPTPENESVGMFTFDPLTLVSAPKHELEFAFLSEIAANLNTCKVGRSKGLDYKKYKDNGKIYLFYLKEVYNQIKDKKPETARPLGQLVWFFEREYSRL